MAAFQSSIFSSPEGRSFNCYLPMPFKKGMKIVVTNENSEKLEAIFYEIDYTIGDYHNDNVLYLHAFFNRQNPTAIRKDYEILPKIEGKGRYMGTNIGIRLNKERYFNSWWGEGEVKVYLDGDTDYPTLCGTGTEDYIGSGWGQGQYTHMYQGCTVDDMEKGMYCFYRYHIVDPVYFHKDILVTIQQIGYLDDELKKELYWLGKEVLLAGYDKPVYLSGHNGSIKSNLFERADDWSSCVYFYLDSPENNLPSIESFEKRTANL
jgi:hypothetical protein